MAWVGPLLQGLSETALKGSSGVRVSSEAQMGKDLPPSSYGFGQDWIPCGLSE